MKDLLSQKRVNFERYIYSRYTHPVYCWHYYLKSIMVNISSLIKKYILYGVNMSFGLELYWCIVNTVNRISFLSKFSLFFPFYVWICFQSKVWSSPVYCFEITYIINTMMMKCATIFVKKIVAGIHLFSEIHKRHQFDSKKPFYL